MSPVVVGNGAIILLHRDEETDLRIFFGTQIFLIKVVGYLFPKAQLYTSSSHQCFVLKSIKAKQVDEHEECFLHLKPSSQQYC